MTAPRILVVDDESDIREMVQDILEDEGYRVTVAADAASARRARENEELDLILLDIWMPDVDGITLLREWSRGGQLDCPVVIMSGTARWIRRSKPPGSVRTNSLKSRCPWPSC